MNMKNVTGPLVFFLFLFVALCMTIPSCGSVDCKDPKNGSNAKCVLAQSVIDCTAPNVQTYVLEHSGEVAKCVTSAGIDWGCAEQALLHLGASEAYCVLEKEVDHYLGGVIAGGSGAISPPDTGSGSAVKATAPPESAADVIAKKDALAAKLWPGKTVKK